MKQCSVAMLAMLIAGLGHADTGVTIRGTDMLAKAQSDAAKIASLSENTKVDVMQRTGAWNEIKATGKTGWVRMFDIKLEPGSRGAAAPSGSAIADYARGRGNHGATDTSGVKGLTKEQILRADPKPAEVDKMSKYIVSKEAAQQFAQRNKLTAVNFEYLSGSFFGSTPAGGPDTNNNSHIPGVN